MTEGEMSIDKVGLQKKIEVLRIRGELTIEDASFPKITTTDADWTQRDESGLRVFAPYPHRNVCKCYASFRTRGVDLGVQLKMNTYEYGWELLEERTWSGAYQHHFYWHDITQRIMESEDLILQLWLKTTAASGILNAGAKIFIVKDFGRSHV